MEDTLWSEIADAPGEIFDIDIDEEELEQTFESKLNSNFDFWWKLSPCWSIKLMTTISFTSGELFDIIEVLSIHEEELHKDGNHQTSAYYQDMIRQLELIRDKLEELPGEDRVANLVLAVN